MDRVAHSEPQPCLELSILLPAHDNVCVELVGELQRQAAQVPGLHYEILVADDGSTDQNAIQANRAINGLPHCRLIERRHNVGRAAIRNFLAREAKYARLLFIDSDLHVCSSTFLERYLHTGGLVVVGGLRIGGAPEKWVSNLRYRYEKACEHQHDSRHRSMSHSQEFRTTNFVIGRDVARQCPFDEDFCHYGYEDVLLGKAIADRGIRITHIDNPVMLDDYEDNGLFMDKTEEACRTLLQFRSQLAGYSKLLRWQERTGGYPGLSRLLDWLYGALGQRIRRMLINGKPPISLYNAYKLLYYIHLCSTNEKIPGMVQEPGDARVNRELRAFVEQEIIPLYAHFDKAHQESHARQVIEQSLQIATHYDVDLNMVYAIAAYHDLGLCKDRQTHHLVSGRIIRNDKRLHKWFTQEQSEMMAQAVEDHRASSGHEPRSIYGKIVAEADRLLDGDTILRRTIQYGLDHYPLLSREEHIERALEHLEEKYGEGGYLKLWIPQSPNASRLRQLQQDLKDREGTRRCLERIYDEEKQPQDKLSPTHL